MRRTIVILHPGALGDVLLSVPAIRRLRSRFPDHESVLVANEAAAHVLCEAHLIDSGISLEEATVSDIFAGSLPVFGPVRDALSRCDCAVAWTQDREGVLAATLRSFGVREPVVQSPFSERLAARHQSDRFLETLAALPGVVLSDGDLQTPFLSWDWKPAHLGRAGIPSGGAFALVHPGSGSRHKCVQPMVLAAVVERLADEGLQPILLEGPADRESVDALRRLCSVEPPVLRGWDLSALAGLFLQARFYLGHDSGLTHLAALLGVRTIALFGPTDPARWAPRGSHVLVLRGAPCECKPWEAVRACSGKPCLAISTDEVRAACKTHGLSATTPRNPSQCALSLPTSYAKVTS